MLMKILVYKKDFFKESVEVRKAIIDSIYDLYTRIQLYQSQNIEFDKIYNDDKIKYDKHGNELFTYKCQKANVQLRILYVYKIIHKEPVFLIADYAIKKKNNKKYIKVFDKFNNYTFEELLDTSLCII